MLRDEFLDLLGLKVVDPERLAGAACGVDQRSRPLDRLGPLHVRRAGDVAAASGRVDERSHSRELDGDRATCAAGRSGYECHPAG